MSSERRPYDLPAYSQRRLRAMEEALMVAWIKGFCWGVGAAMAMLIGTTLMYCAGKGGC
jgi:hypothetical protein